MMPGEGIGPEMMEHVRHVYKVAGVPVDFETVKLDPTTDNYDDLYNVKTEISISLMAFLNQIQFVGHFICEEKRLRYQRQHRNQTYST